MKNKLIIRGVPSMFSLKKLDYNLFIMKKIFTFSLLFLSVSCMVSLAQTAPSALVVTAVSSDKICLSWTDNSNNETGFQIERSLTSGSGYTLVTTSTANSKAYSDAGLTAGNTYYYRVRAV